MLQPPGLRYSWRDEVRAVALRQWGSISAAQLRRRGIDRHTVGRDVRARRLFVVHDRVYAIVPPELLSPQGRLAAAVLAGGPGARLCDVSAAAWLEVMDVRPSAVHVAVPRARRPIEGIVWHELTLQPGDAGKHRGMPVTSPARTALDLAAHAPGRTMGRVLAELEWRFGLDAEALQAVLRRGHPGSAALRRAIARHLPELAATRSELERAFLEFLADHGFPMPLVNHPVGSSTVDCLFPEHGIVVELDGVRGHSGERRVLRDHRRDLHRRADGLRPLRYHFEQLRKDRALVVADLVAAGLPREPPALRRGFRDDRREVGR